ncbi:MAG: tetratricopeptide repeat protein [Verrucomicrobiota bacterium]
MKPTRQRAGLTPLTQAFLGACFFGLLVWAYLPALRGGFIWDDDAYVTENQTLRNLSGLWEIWFDPSATPQYYPLVHTSYWIEHHFWGLNPLGFHLTNLGLHVFASLLLWRVLSVLQISGAWLAAALFACHPVQVESVAWVTERKNVLSAVFYFSAALAFFRFYELGAQKVSWRRAFFYGLAFFLYMAALLSKTITCSLPAALLLIIWWKSGTLRSRDFLAVAPMFMVGIVFSIGTVFLEQNHVGASGPEWLLSFAERVLIAGRALWFYIFKLIVPANLIFIYPRWQLAPHLWWQWLYPSAALLVLFSMWRFRALLGRGPLVAVLFFAGTLFPALGFVNVYPMRYSFVADHFQYLACVGVFVLFASGACRFPRLILIPVALLLVFLGLSRQQAAAYVDVKILWESTLRKNPSCWMAHNNLGMIFKEEGRIDEAVVHYREALRLNSEYPEAHYNLGIVSYQSKQIDDALFHFQAAVRLKPEDAEARNNLGATLRAKGRLDEAIFQFREALKLKPDYDLAWLNLARTIEIRRALSRGAF